MLSLILVWLPSIWVQARHWFGLLGEERNPAVDTNALVLRCWSYWILLADSWVERWNAAGLYLQMRLRNVLYNSFVGLFIIFLMFLYNEIEVIRRVDLSSCTEKSVMKIIFPINVLMCRTYKNCEISSSVEPIPVEVINTEVQRGNTMSFWKCFLMFCKTFCLITWNVFNFFLKIFF